MISRCCGVGRLVRDPRGVAATEFAIIAPLLIVFLGGILIYGLYFATIHSLQQLVAEASRATIPGLDDRERERLAQAHIDGVIANYALLQKRHLVVRSATDPASRDRYSVSLTYDATHLGLNAFAALLPQQPERIARTAFVRKGGV